jgi:hypothetical protein
MRTSSISPLKAQVQSPVVADPTYSSRLSSALAETVFEFTTAPPSTFTVNVVPLLVIAKKCHDPSAIVTVHGFARVGSMQ